MPSASPRVRAATTTTSDTTNKLDTGFLLCEILDLCKRIGSLCAQPCRFLRGIANNLAVYTQQVAPTSALPPRLAPPSGGQPPITCCPYAARRLATHRGEWASDARLWHMTYPLPCEEPNQCPLPRKTRHPAGDHPFRGDKRTSITSICSRLEARAPRDANPALRQDSAVHRGRR